jgi:hypothetical protein
VIVREYEEDDLEQIKELHARSRIEYSLPDISGTDIFSRKVISDRSGVHFAAFLRLSAEALLVCDSSWRTPAWRLQALRELQCAGRRDCVKHNVGTVNAFLAPAIERRFGARLIELGWQRYKEEEWKCYSCEVTPRG